MKPERRLLLMLLLWYVEWNGTERLGRLMMMDEMLALLIKTGGENWNVCACV